VKKQRNFECVVRTNRETEFVEITGIIQECVEKSGVREGIGFLYLPHVTAAFLSQENADGGRILQDLEELLERMVPKNKTYHHSDGNAHAHLKASLFGNNKTILIHKGALVLGAWEGIFLGEFDGPRERRLLIQIVPTE
jgi:secondary thiamine-phosphate synthase enzyme